MDDRASILSQYLRSKGSPLVRSVPSFISAADKYGLDYRLLPAISGIETSFGKTGTGANGPFGYASAKDWGSTDRAIDVAARGLANTTGYYKNASTIDQIGRIWAPVGASNDPNGTNGGWVGAVNQFYRELGGSPGAKVRGGVAGNIATNPASPTAARPSGGMSVNPAAINDFMRASDAQLEESGGDLTGMSMLMGKYAKALAAAQATAPRTPATAAANVGATAMIPNDGTQPRLSKWGGPHDHGARALGNWQSDLAWDLGGPAGTGIYAPLGGTIVKVGDFGKEAQFRGHGITIDHGGGRTAFYKHLDSLAPGIVAGARVTPGMLLGGLASGTGGGPHLHLGANTESFLNSLADYYL